MINLLIASYQFAQMVLSQHNEVVYVFTTDHNVTYYVFITKLQYNPFIGLSFANDVLEITLKPAPNSKLPKGVDKRIAVTLAAIVKDYLAPRSNIIPVYVCSEEDGQEDARAKKFLKTFASGNTGDEYKQAVFDKDRYKGALIYKTGHPAEADILKVSAAWSQ